MKMYSKHILFSVLITIFISLNSHGQIQSSSSIGGLAGAPMRMGFGARGIAMGNSMTGIIDHELHSYYNPAILPFVSIPTLDIAYCILSFDRKLNFLSFSNNIKPNAGFSISVINAGVTNIDGRNRDGIHTETYSTSENAFIFSFGLRPNPNFSIGVSAKILYYYLFENMKSTTAAIDVGILYVLTDGLTIGAAIQDIKGKYHWNSSKLYGIDGKDFYDNFPLRKKIGLAWLQKDLSFIISSELEMVGSGIIARVGSEIELIPGLALRGGIDQISLDSDLLPKPSLGFSLESQSIIWMPKFQYTYVFEPYSINGIHILSLAYKFK